MNIVKRFTVAALTAAALTAGTAMTANAETVGHYTPAPGKRVPSWQGKCPSGTSPTPYSPNRHIVCVGRKDGRWARYVAVKPGQTLWRLAVIYRGDGHEWREIARLNGIKGTTIYAGQVLRVR